MLICFYCFCGCLVPVHFPTCTVKLQFSGRYLTTEVQNYCIVIHCATLLYRKFVEPSKLTNVRDRNTNCRRCDEFKSVIHSLRPTEAALEAAVTIVSESQTQKSRIYMHCFPLPFRQIFFSSSWPAAPMSCTERKKSERRHWLRLSTYGCLEITLSIGIISQWAKLDMTMNSRGNRLWHVPCFFVVFFSFGPHWWCDEFHKQKPPRQEEDKPNYCLFCWIDDSSTRTISSTPQV